jgi:hypothetical protein
MLAGGVAGCLLALLDGLVVFTHLLIGVRCSGNMTCENLVSFPRIVGVHLVPP